MSSIPLYKAFIEVGASEDSASKAAEDVIRVSQLEQLATKADIGRLEANMAKQESRLIKWMVGSCSFLPPSSLPALAYSSRSCCPPGLRSKLP